MVKTYHYSAVSFPLEWYAFCAEMTSNSVRLGRVKAISPDDARAQVQKFFIGGMFFPNQIYTWPERDIIEIGNT